MEKLHFLDEFWPWHHVTRIPSAVSLFPSFFPSLSLFTFLSFRKHLHFSLAPSVLPFFVLRFRMFLFIKARIATNDEGVLPFPHDLHKISIFEASREKYRRVTRTRWWIPPTETGPSRFNVREAHHKREIVIFTARFRFRGYVLHSLPRFIPLLLHHTFSIHPRVSVIFIRTWICTFY